MQETKFKVNQLIFRSSYHAGVVMFVFSVPVHRYSLPHPDWFHLVVVNLPFCPYNRGCIPFCPCAFHADVSTSASVAVPLMYLSFLFVGPSTLHEHLWFLHLHFDPKHLLPLVSGTEHPTAKLTKSLTSNHHTDFL